MVTPSVSLRPLAVAVIVARPMLTPVTRPLFESTVATAGALLDHVKTALIGLLFTSDACALRSRLAPTCRVVLFGLTMRTLLTRPPVSGSAPLLIQSRMALISLIGMGPRPAGMRA